MTDLFLPSILDIADMRILIPNICNLAANSTDELHGWLSRSATKKIMEREYEVYGHNLLKELPETFLLGSSFN